MPRFDRILVALLVGLYPRWFRVEHERELRDTYEAVLTDGHWRRRGRLRTVLWLVRDAVATALRLWYAGPSALSARGGWVLSGLRHFPTDLRNALRGLARSPSFALVAAVTMGVGIGLNVSVLSVVHSVLIRPLPYEEPDELVQLSNRYQPDGGTGWISVAEYWEYRNEVGVLTATAPVSPDAGNLTGMARPVRLEGLVVSPTFFDLVGAQPAMGRAFLPEEESPGQEPVVILGHSLWQTVFGEDPDVLGETIELGGRFRRIVGVMGPEYRPVSEYLFPGRAEQYFVPLEVDPSTFDSVTVERHNLLVLGRLAEDVSPREAEQQLRGAVMRIEQLYPGLSNSGSRDVEVLTLQRAANGPVRDALFLLTASAALVLLVACSNIANLLLARAEARSGEVAIRAAMGAARARLFGHGLAEGLAIGILGGGLGLILALLATDALVAAVPPGTRLSGNAAPGLSLPAFTAGIALLAGVLSGLLPALRAGRVNLFTAIRSGGNEERSGGSRPLGRGLVVAQIAGAVVLIASASLLVRSIVSLRSVDVGFETADLYGIQISATPDAYADGNEVRDLFRRIEAGVAGVAGVELAAASWQTPLQSGMSDWPVMPRIEGGGEWHAADPNLVGGDFFGVYGIEVLEGRPFEPGDTDRLVGPVILNQTGARSLFGEESAVGRFVNLSFGDPVWREVIGVVEDIRGRGLAEAPRIQTYMTYGEGPFGSAPSLVLNIRTALDPGSLERAVADVVRGIDPDIPVGTVRSMESVVEGSLTQERLLSLLLGVFGGVALVLGAIGVYGLVSYSVSRRSREIGLRIAVGARAGSVVGLVVRQGMTLGGLGVAAGVAGSLLSGRLLEGFVFGVSETDPVAIAGAGVLMLGVAAVASFVPARRATEVDPLSALRK